MSMMQNDGMLSSLSPDAYATYLEQLSDTDFWSLAFEKAHVHYATVAAVEESSRYSLECLTCGLRTAQCAMPLPYIREILPTPPYITALPAMPAWMTGILSWRGETVAVIDLCAYLTGSEVTPLTTNAYMIVQHADMLLALCLLSVSAVSTIVDTLQVTPFVPPSQMSGDLSSVIVGVVQSNDSAQSQLFLLDVPNLFADIVKQVQQGEGMSSHG